MDDESDSDSLGKLNKFDKNAVFQIDGFGGPLAIRRDEASSIHDLSFFLLLCLGCMGAWGSYKKWARNGTDSWI